MLPISVGAQEDYNSFPFQVILMLTNDSTMDTNSQIEIIEDQTNGRQNAMKRKTLQGDLIEYSHFLNKNNS